MAKSQTNDATNKANSIYNQVQSTVAPVVSGLQSSNQALTGTQTQLGQNVTGIAQGLASPTGGYDPTQLAAIESGYGGLTTTGAGIGATGAGISNFGENLMATGGYTPAQQAAYLNQATSGVTATGDILEQQAKQAAAATGGYGALGTESQIANQLEQNQATATQNALLGLNQQMTANELAGAGAAAQGAGVTATGAGVTGAGLGGLQTTQQSITANQATGAGLENQLYNTQTGQITQQGQQILSALGLQFGTESQAISALQQLSQNPGLFGNIVQGLKAVNPTFSI
jgi:hypothetical protein